MHMKMFPCTSFHVRDARGGGMNGGKRRVSEGNPPSEKILAVLRETLQSASPFLLPFHSHTITVLSGSMPELTSLFPRGKRCPRVRTHRGRQRSGTGRKFYLLPSCEKAMALTPFLWPLRIFSVASVLRSQI